MDFTVSHFIGIIAIIVIAVKAIGEYYKHKDDRLKIISDPPLEDTAPTRIQHYKFAHEVLKNMFFEDEDDLIKNTLISEGELRGLWYDVGNHYAKHYPEIEKLDGSDINITAKEFEDTLFIAISLPKPEQDAEAYFVGLIVQHTTKDKSRYIILEKCEKGSVLCEWTQEAHLNFGEGSEPTLHKFQDKLIAMGNVSVKTWDDAKKTYSGDDWMISLWNWADTHDISPLILPRNSKDLQDLEQLALSFINLQIEYLPKEIGKLSNLHTFALQGSKLKELPGEFSNLANLKYLYLDGNKLTRLPNSICNLSKLEKITLSENNLTSLPGCIGKLQHLFSLNLNVNLIEELPESMYTLNLKELRLLDNPLKSISYEVQSFLTITRQKDASQKEPFNIVWMFCDETNGYSKRFDVPNSVGSLPFFLSGEEVESNNLPLTERHLLLGVLYGLNLLDELPVYSDEKILIGLVSTLSEGYGYETIEEMVLHVSTAIRNNNGTTSSRLMLETGHKLIPKSSKILEHLIFDLWSEVSLSDENTHLFEEIPIRVKKVDLAAIHPYSKQLICYYGLCALIFIHSSKNEDYLESDLVEDYLKNYFYPNVMDKLLMSKAVKLMKNPEKFQPIDLMSSMT